MERARLCPPYITVVLMAANMGRRTVTRRTALASLVIALLGGLLAHSNAAAQQYPTRPITLVVPFAPGGLSDVPARVLAAEMQMRIGHSVVVENKPGASGVTGATYVWRADPDGYTLLVNALADVQNLHYLAVPYDPIKDFALIGMITDGPPLVLIVNVNAPYRSIDELIAYAKNNPDMVSFGTSGPATSPAIAVTQLNNFAHTHIVQVPYRGSAPAAAAVAANEVQGSFVFYPNARSLSDSGLARALAVTSPHRIASWTEIPTMEELGYPGFHHAGFVGLAAPPNTPRPIIEYLNRELNEVIHSSSFKSKIEPLGMTVPAINTPETFTAFMHKELERQRELAKLSGHQTQIK
jgi:tripartite-type tricarboxylate transporter receptor subunit TctC